MLKRDDVLKRKKGRKEDQKEERMKWGENKKRKKEKRNKGKKKEIKEKKLSRSFACLLTRLGERAFPLYPSIYIYSI